MGPAARWTVWRRPADAPPEVGWAFAFAVEGGADDVWAEAVVPAPGQFALHDVVRVDLPGRSRAHLFVGPDGPVGVPPPHKYRAARGPIERALRRFGDDWVGAWWSPGEPHWPLHLAAAAGVDRAALVRATAELLGRPLALLGAAAPVDPRVPDLRRRLDEVARYARGAASYGALRGAYVEGPLPTGAADGPAGCVDLGLRALARAAGGMGMAEHDPAGTAWHPLPPEERPGPPPLPLAACTAVSWADRALRDLRAADPRPGDRRPDDLAEALRREHLPLAAVLLAATEGRAPARPRWLGEGEGWAVTDPSAPPRPPGETG